MYICVLMALITTLVLCARSQDLVMSVSVRRVLVVFSTAGGFLLVIRCYFYAIGSVSLLLVFVSSTGCLFIFSCYS